MIKIVAKSLIKEDKVEAFKEVVRELVEKSSAEEGNISYSINVSKDNPRLFAFIEVWRDQKALDLHNATEHFQRIVPITRQMREDGSVEIYYEVEYK